MRWECLAAILLGLVGTGCGSKGAGPAARGDHLLVRTDRISVPAGEEAFVCYAKTLEEDLVVDRIDYAARPLVHHLLLVQATAREPEGLSACPVLFRPSWLMLFGAATADASLELPPGVGIVLPKGTQILIQLHVLNTGTSPASDVAEIALRKSPRRDVETVGLFAFGTSRIELPPRQGSAVTHACTLREDVRVFAVVPHMHYLGTSLSFEIGASDSELREVYRREPWSFDDQYLEPLVLDLRAGTRTRVTCSYHNPTDRTVTFGESSNDEMCYLVTFARGRRGIQACDDGAAVDVPRDPRAGTCGEQTPNGRGIGSRCTRGGGECAAGLACSLDQPQAPPDSPGFCLEIGGCQVTADCGGGWATCCAPAQAGGLVNICIPEACRPADCVPK
jgi:hypothetical protein